MRKRREPSLVFLKLGGSLLGDKRNPRSFRRATVRRLAREIGTALRRSPGMRLLLGHGGGGFAHHPATKFRTREGLRGGGGWQGFGETRKGVRAVNGRVLDCCAAENLFPVTVPPCAGVTASRGRISRWDTDVIRILLERGQIPLVHGDAVVDERWGFTILSTEELFAFLAERFQPARVILACDVDGVYPVEPRAPLRAAAVELIDGSNISEIRRILRRPARSSRRSAACDVTGGMAAKVEQLYGLVGRVAGLEARIISGMRPGVVQSVLLGGEGGTTVRC